MESVASYFTWIDWGVVALYLVFTTWIGHRLKGKQSTINDFFRAGRSLPWPAVAGSIIATEISALTFIGVPAMVFAATGNFTYMQWAIGSIIARILVGIFLVPRYYREEIYSPYDYIGGQLGEVAKRLTTVLFFLGSVLGQSVRVLVTALILRTVTGMDFHLCIIVISIFAIGWTLMGGMATVIWTDVVQFFLFVFGGAMALVWMILSLPGGMGEWIEVGQAAHKFRIIDLTTDPSVGFTLWVGILAMPFQNLAAFGTDQLNAQRMLCCRSADDAKKAIIWSSVSQCVTLLMLMVGVALFAYYQAHPPSQALQSLFQEDGDTIFPSWITMVLPVGLSGLVLAGAFAAAISSLDSILTALSQTTLSLFRKTQEPDPNRDMRISRILVCCWGILLAGFAIALDQMRGDINMVNLAFGMVAYTYGPLLGILCLALLPRKIEMGSMLVGALVAVLITIWARPEMYTILTNFGVLDSTSPSWKPSFHYAWLYPITCLVTLGIGLIRSRA
ncbi:MAG: sodium/solute symporter [Verrucomicrobiota bacterium]